MTWPSGTVASSLVRGSGARYNTGGRNGRNGGCAPVMARSQRAARCPSTACPRNGSELPHEPDEDARGQGQHRKWVAELTGEEWLAFAGAYLIGLDEDGMPEEYGETLGSLTAEYGLLPAVCVENGEGWDDYSGSQVIYSTFYVSLGYIGGPDISADEAALAAWETDGGAVVAVDVP